MLCYVILYFIPQHIIPYHCMGTFSACGLLFVHQLKNTREVSSLGQVRTKLLQTSTFRFWREDSFASLWYVHRTGTVEPHSKRMHNMRHLQTSPQWLHHAARPQRGETSTRSAGSQGPLAPVRYCSDFNRYD